MLTEKEIRDKVAGMSMEEMANLRAQGFKDRTGATEIMLLFANVVARRAVREVLGLPQEGGEEEV